MSANGTPIRFILDGELVSVTDVPPTMTLLEYLREHLGRTGTKEGCAEGDCGACTVVLGELDGDAMRYRSINACIRFLAAVDGKEVVTAESLSKGEAMHPVQQAMADCHGSQCGFCTPGFVMSLFDLYLNKPDADRGDVVTALAGNLCRCTGYRPIIDAGCRMGDYPTPETWSRQDAQSRERVERLKAIQHEGLMSFSSSGGSFFAPRTTAELASIYDAYPDAVLLAGGTDVGLWATKQLREFREIVHLADVAELRRIRVDGDTLEIGAAASLTDAYAGLCEHYPALQELYHRFASPPIRNAGTFCGNVANGSPIGDSMPFLLALNASVALRRGEHQRLLPLDDFYLGYQKKALEPGEFIEAVRVPLPSPGQMTATYKVSKRIDQDISAVCGAYAVTVEQGRVTAARIAYGGMAATPLRAPRAEAALLGQPWSAATMDKAAAMLAHDYTPIADMRASAGYRLTVARNLLKRFFLEHGGTTAPTRLDALATDMEGTEHVPQIH
ncbi:MAG: xanthine dehydrogenase small subunit [Ectothiorhodospiraceae bacterium]|nr:xanthine dehydrogenase small subunit [Ectothiorhodospiraceae bacterium]